MCQWTKFSIANHGSHSDIWACKNHRQIYTDWARTGAAKYTIPFIARLFGITTEGASPREHGL